jgi:DNA-binding XRE family transcriptional regulator
MPGGRIPNRDRLRRMAELQAEGMSYGRIGQLLGVTRQCVQRALNPKRRPRCVRIRCRECDGDINHAGAVPRDDHDVLCLRCLAQRPDAAFGEHLKAFRMAAGMKIVDLAQKADIRPTVISGYEHGRIGAPSWTLMVRLFQALGVSLSIKRTSIVNELADDPSQDHSQARQTNGLLSLG